MSFLRDTLEAMGANRPREENARAMAVTGLLADVELGADWIKEERRNIALRHAVMRRALLEVVEALGYDIPHVVLKGEPLAEILYGDSSLRPSTDIDLLILPGDYEEVRRRVIELGYVPAHEEGPRKWAYNQEALHHSTHGVALEIHWMLAFPALPALSPLPLFDTRREFELNDDLVVDVLRGDWLGIHLALHFQQHKGFAKGLLDLAAWCDRVAPALEREPFLAKAEEWRLTGLVQWPLHTLEILTGARPPMYVEDVDSTVKMWATISTWALKDCLSREFDGGIRDSLASLNPTVGPELSVPMRAGTMLVVDGSRMEKLRGALRPILQGPHFVGRAMKQWGLIR